MDQPYTSEYAELFGCSHRWTVKYQQKTFCQQCGIYCDQGVRVFKTLKLKYNTFFDPLKLMDDALKTAPVIDLSSNAEYLQIRPNLIDFIYQVADLLHLNINTSFLAIQFMDKLQPHKVINSSENYLYSATSLMLAAKTIELDERIPFISKLKRYAAMTTYPDIRNFGTSDFRRAECKIIQTLKWDLQQLTLIDRVEYLMSFGILDDDDSIQRNPPAQVTPLKETNQITRNENDSSTRQKSQSQMEFNEKKFNLRLKELSDQEILDIVKQVESTYKHTCMTVVKDQIMFQQDPVVLALACVAYMRKNLGLLNIWSQQLQSLTGYSAQQISSTVSQIISIFSKKQLSTTSTTKLYTQNNLLTYASLSRETPSLFNTTSNNSINSRLENIKPNRKVHQYTYLNINENNSFTSFTREYDRNKPLKLNSFKQINSFEVCSGGQPHLVRGSSNAYQGRLFH